MRQLSSKRSPGRPKQEEFDTPTSEAILRVAARLFTEHGYEGVSVEAIATASNVTKASVYYYFSNKANLFTESFVRMMNFITQTTVSILQQDKPLRDRLLTIAEQFLSGAGASANFHELMKRSELSLASEQIAKIRAAEDRIYASIAEEFANAVKQNEIRHVNPVFAARSFGAIMMMGNMTDVHGHVLFESPHHAANHVVDLFWSGVANRPLS